MNTNAIPKHVAIIMDGNRRWAKKKGLPAVAGHAYVVEQLVERLIEHATKRGISYLTLWAFSTENWNRNEKEVIGIMKLFRWALEKRGRVLIEKGARVRMIGDLEKFPDDIREGFERMIESSKNNTKITVTFALNYGGRSELVYAMNKLAEERVSYPGDRNERITDQDISNQLYTAKMPDPDMIIRPGGEKRLSGFMLWQSEYSELYFTDVLMPDFDEGQFDMALEEYANRQRRFGK